MNAPEINTKKLALSLVLLILLSLVQGLVSAQQLELPKNMPDWQLESQEGDLVSNQEFKEQALTLHFWSTHCPF